MADASKPRFDAVLAPAQYPPGKAEYDRLVALKNEFGPILGSNRVHSRYAANGMALITATATPKDHQFYASDHPEAGQDRFEFVDRGDGVLYGLKKPDALSQTPADAAKAESDRAAGHKATVLARRDGLAAIPEKDRTPDQNAELEKLGRFIPLMFPDEPAPPQAKAAAPAKASHANDTTPPPKV